MLFCVVEHENISLLDISLYLLENICSIVRPSICALRPALSATFLKSLCYHEFLSLTHQTLMVHSFKEGHKQ